MKVLHVSYNDIIAGAGIAAYRCHRALKNSGIDSRMLVVRKASENDTVIRCGGVVHGRIGNVMRNQLVQRFFQHWNPQPSYGISLNLTPTGLHRRIQSLDPDVVHLHWINGEMISIPEITKIDCPVVWTFHDLWPILGINHHPANSSSDINKSHGWVDRWIRSRKRRYWSQFHPQVVCVGTWLADQVKRSETFGSDHIHVIPNVIDSDIFRPFDQLLARDSLALEKDTQYLCFGAVKGGKHIKGFDLLKEAMFEMVPRIEGSGSRLEVLIFGNDDPGKDSPLPCPVRYLGRIQDPSKLAEIYSACDVMCVPSRQETFGLTAAESMACGTPVVAFATTGLMDIVDHGFNGYLAKPFDPIDYSAGLEWILNIKAGNCDSHPYSELRRRCRQKVLDAFSPEHVAEAYKAIYKTMIGQHK